MNNKKWLTTEQAAEYLSKSPLAIRMMVQRGHLKAKKFHRRLYFDRAQIDETIELSF